MTDHVELTRLASELGVQTWYWDTRGNQHQAGPDALVAVLRALGAPAERVDDLGALRHHVDVRRSRPVEPVLVASAGDPVELVVRVPATEVPDRLVVHRHAEGTVGERHEVSLAGSPAVDRIDLDGRALTVHRVRLGSLRPPVGYHRLTVELGGGLHPTTLVVAPPRVPEPGVTERTWGVLAALHGLRTGRPEAPNVHDLARLGERVADAGGRVVATLPILATYLSDPFDPSPYSPVSQRYWNESYLDVTATPELRSSERARALLESPEVRSALAGIDEAPLFDHRRRYALLRPVLDELAATAMAAPAAVRRPFDDWAASHPDASRYAAFRAAADQHATGWHGWGLGPGRLPPGADGSPEAATHLWSQWTMSRQLDEVAGMLRDRDVRLYLDLPVGTHGDGFDTWADHDLYGWGCGVGAPPDDFFADGQSWGFPPVSPEASRAMGHGPLAASLRHHMAVAGMLRLDHVMGFERLFWVPDGMAATDGVYVRYPAEELFAVLAVEAHRAGCRVVGEDLGTVTDDVRAALERNGLLGMFVSQFRLPAAHGEPVPVPNHRQVASIDTHDTPTFAGWYRAEDITLRRDLGLHGDDRAVDDTLHRDHQRAALEEGLRRAGVLHGEVHDAAVLGALLELLGRSEAPTVLVSVDDLAGETDPQNVPGTTADRPNWVRKLPCTLDELFTAPTVEALLTRLQGARLDAHLRAAEEVR